ARSADLTFSLGYMSYSMGETPFKPKGAPDTDWEIISSSLHMLVAEVDLSWSFPLDAAERWSFDLGGGLGIGVAFAGNLFRTQAYPPGFKPGNPSSYRKCAGPNDPAGSFRYCNTLDKDATHYGGYADADWFHGGLRPLIYPWVVLPELGVSFRPTPSI